MKNHPFRPKKAFGQHFLTSTGAVLDMVKSASIESTDTLLEIGPGKGVLTEKLIASAKKVIIVEKDTDLIPFLKEKFIKEIEAGKLDLVEGDILTCDIPKLLGKTKSYKLVANIPYYITGEILRTFLTIPNKPKSITVLVQKEVAERITHKGDPKQKESILSLSVQLFGDPHYISTVKRGSFYPIPNVDSAILHINITHNPTEKFEKMFFSLIKSGFSSKRKKLLSNLQAVVEKPILEKYFIEQHIDTNIRAEDVHLDTWKHLTETILGN